MSTYTGVVQASRSLSGVANLALRNDLTEMHLTMAASAGLFPLPGMAAAASAGVAIWSAKTRCDAALARVTGVTEGWLSASQQSPHLLHENARQWEELGRRARDISKDMEILLTRSRENGWEGEANAQKEEFHAAELDAQTAFSEELSKVPMTLETANNVTKGLFTSLASMINASRLTGMTIAGRFPLPRPAGFGLCTRTPLLAQELEGLAGRLEQQRAAGSWRFVEASLGMAMTVLGASMRSRRQRNGR
ncbi:MAG: hypothetical protein GX596_11770 [Propionibacterium sp.]|nr:hypothetical protein [Propionibacterium sp.]